MRNDVRDLDAENLARILSGVDRDAAEKAEQLVKPLSFRFRREDVLIEVDLQRRRRQAVPQEDRLERLKAMLPDGPSIIGAHEDGDPRARTRESEDCVPGRTHRAV